MSEAIILEKQPILVDSQNYALLREAGISYIEKLAHELWTDYNVHDPGITFLELLCYAVTDLGYRTAYDMKDLLTELDMHGHPKIYTEFSFHTAKHIFSSQPVSFNDLRKWLIDIEGIHQAWISIHQSVQYCLDTANEKLKNGKCTLPGEQKLEYLNGLFDVLLEFEDFVESEPRIVHIGERPLTAAGNLQQANRQGIVFDIKYPIVLQAVNIYPGVINAGSFKQLTLRLYYREGGNYTEVIFPNGPAQFKIQASSQGKKTRLPLGWQLDTGRTYLIIAESPDLELAYSDPGQYPYYSLGPVELRTGYDLSAATEDNRYYFFYDWEINYAVSPLQRNKLFQKDSEWSTVTAGLASPSPSSADNKYLTVAQKGLQFHVYAPIRLISLDVYPESLGEVTIRLLDKNRQVLKSKTFQITDAGQANSLNLQWEIEPDLFYTIDAEGSTVNLFKEKQDAGVFSFPLKTSNVFEIYGAIKAINDPTSLQYYFFYNWQIQIRFYLPPALELTREDLQLAAKERLHLVRNLCEDFVHIHYLKVEEIGLCADIEVTPGADIETILAEVFYQMEWYVSPPVNFYTIEELQKKGRTSDQIFEGPLLDHGFIDDEEFRRIERRCFLRVSDIVQLLMDIPEVKAVKEIFLLSFVKKTDTQTVPSGAQTVHWQGEEYWAVQQPWILELQDINAFAPNFNPGISNLTFYKNGLPYLPNRKRVLEIFEEKRAQNFRNKIKGHADDLAIPQGTFRELETYYPFQNELPATYRAGQYRTLDSDTELRKAQARQLKAYLLFFEQLMANYLAQLTHARDLFSWKDDQTATYFTQKIEWIADLPELYVDFSELQSDLLEIVETSSVAQERKNRFLDHLLGRFSEDFTEYSLLMYSLLKDEAPGRVIKDKQCMLKNYPEASNQRGRAFDYRFPDDAHNLSGYQQRLYRLLGIHHNECSIFRRNFAWQNLEVDAQGIKLHDGGNPPKVFFVSNPDYPCNSEEQLCALLDNLIVFAANIKHWRYNAATLRWELFQVCVYEEEKEEEVFGFTTGEITSEADFKEKVLGVFEHLAQNEGFHVVEHILLRKRTLEDPFLSVELINSEEDCPCVEVKDPYSFRASIILPSWPERFQSIRFRQYVEKMLRLEAPAHVYLKICWISHCEMRVFEHFHQEWLRHHAKLKDAFKGAMPLPATASLRSLEKAQMTEYTDKLELCIRKLENLTNIFPVSRLHDCETVTGEEPQISLNNTSLGSL